MTINKSTIINNGPIEIAGAGPAGLAAAITLAKTGRNVIVHEARKEVGSRFAKDFQGLENWTTKQDVLLVFKDLGLNTDFKKIACYSGTVFGYKDKAYEFHSEKPIFYLIERGAGDASLDTIVLRQPQSIGVDVRFNSRLQKMVGPGIFASGVKSEDAIAVGYHFETTMDNGFWVNCDGSVAPKSYANLF